MLYMFRTILVHHQEQLYKLYIVIGIWRYVWLLCDYIHTTARRMVRLDVSSSTRITTYQSLRIQLVQNAPDDGPMRPETCRANISAE